MAIGLLFFFRAFYDLDTERSLDTLQPIPWSAIVNYGSFHNLRGESMSDLLYLIRDIDNAYLARIAEKRKAR